MDVGYGSIDEDSHFALQDFWDTGGILTNPGGLDTALYPYIVFLQLR